MTFLADEQSYRDNAELTRFLVDAIDETEAQPLFTGTLVVSYELPPADGFTVGYEFDVAGERYCYVMHGPRSGAIARGELDPRSVSSYSGQRGRLLLLDEDPTGPPLQETHDTTFTFELSRLLPKGDSVTQLGVSSLHLGFGNPIIDDFLRRYTLEVNTSRLYSLATPLARITRELTLLNDRRGKPRRIYRASELNRSPTSQRPITDLPLELLRLKLGTAAERERYSEIQT